MLEYILDYLANRGVYAASQGEQQQMEDGIARYLQENGLEDGNTGAYYQKYVSNHLQQISASDLKAYFLNYGLISDVNQIAIEYRCDGSLPEERIKTLYWLMEKMHACGLGEKYVPIIEVKQILGSLASTTFPLSLKYKKPWKRFAVCRAHCLQLPVTMASNWCGTARSFTLRCRDTI